MHSSAAASQLVYWIAQGVLQKLHIMRSTKKRINILSGLSGTIKPGRLTLLLGPPSSGKTTLLKALAGKLRGTGLKVRHDSTPAHACHACLSRQKDARTKGVPDTTRLARAARSGTPLGIQPQLCAWHIAC